MRMELDYVLSDLYDTLILAAMNSMLTCYDAKPVRTNYATTAYWMQALADWINKSEQEINNARFTIDSDVDVLIEEFKILLAHKLGVEDNPKWELLYSIVCSDAESFMSCNEIERACTKLVPLIK
jgi:hypothetical protein